MMEREFRMSTCPSCFKGKDGKIVWNTITDEVFINDRKVEAEWKIDEEDSHLTSIIGYCGQVDEYEGETEECIEPIKFSVNKSLNGETGYVDICCAHDDSTYVEYYEIIEGQKIKIGSSADHPIWISRTVGGVSSGFSLEPNPAAVKHNLEIQGE
jgi:hypothetical protein